LEIVLPGTQTHVFLEPSNKRKPTLEYKTQKIIQTSMANENRLLIFQGTKSAFYPIMDKVQVNKSSLKSIFRIKPKIFSACCFYTFWQLPRAQIRLDLVEKNWG